MSSRKNIVRIILLAISVSFISTMCSVMLLSKYFSEIRFQMLGEFCGMLTEENIADPDTLMEAVKKSRESVVSANYDNLLEAYGYRAADFTGARRDSLYAAATACSCAGILIVLFTVFYWKRKERGHIDALTEYLEKVNTGGKGLIVTGKESAYSRLEDEIYKTVTNLYQTREDAVAAKRNFADNLYNIAHQLKTPITAISLSAQMIEEKYDAEYARQIQKQVARLTHLEEALLLLSRIDTGTLTFKMDEADVFTVLSLAADHLLELSLFSGVAIDIPESGEVKIVADMEWTMEAMMNLLKNCMEHSPAGATVHTSYEQNPLYVQIRIWDEGSGFEKEDIPHLFERFYRGKNAAKGGIGIGLSLSKEIIEMQNGTIRAKNLPGGGALFEIRMYCH